MIYELCAATRLGIFAVPLRSGRRLKAVRMPDGAIVEAPLPEHRHEISTSLDTAFGVAAGGIPATIHHENLGLTISYLKLSGMYVLPTGELAAIYGAEVVPIDAAIASVR